MLATESCLNSDPTPPFVKPKPPRPRLAAPVNGLQSLYRSQAQKLRRVADDAEAGKVVTGIRIA